VEPAGRALGLAIALTFASLAACKGRETRERDEADASIPDAASVAISSSSSAGPTDDEVITALEPFEAKLHQEIDPRHPPSAEKDLGADPWKVVRVPNSTLYAGILRGRSQLELLHGELRALSRMRTPRSPTGLAVGPDGTIWVTGELSRQVARYVVRGRDLAEHPDRPRIEVPGVYGLRDVAVTPSGTAWVLDERTGRLHPIPSKPNAKTSTVETRCHGASQLTATPRHLLVGCPTEHEVVAFDTDASGGVTNADTPRRVRHDGPIWAFDAREVGDAVIVAMGGVENTPLDRRQGFFGYIDSFLYVYRFESRAVTKLAEINVGELGIVTPKAIAITNATAAGAAIFLGAYGSPNGATVTVANGAEPKVVVHPLVPGLRTAVADGEAMIMADPLLDAWVSWAPNAGRKVVPAEHTPPATSTQTRVGEALFFTTLMAPNNTTAGAHSRFTCETCHFEGYVDGRTHHTGREDIRAVTKPLVGLFGNRPYFTRALDPDLSTIAHAEFRVAGAGSDTTPFFAVDPKRVSWLELMVPESDRSTLDEPLDGYELRRSLMRFLASFSHRPNPAVVGRKTFTAEERRGAGVFRDRCETCHSARLAADDAASVVPFEAWEASIFSDESPIVWARAGYEKTGVLPYVHEQGAKTTSLRRMYKKHPYFTNGSARSVADVVSRARIAGSRFFHGNPPADATPLDEADRTALLAFLELL